MRGSVWPGSDPLRRTRSLADIKTFTVSAELTKPSQSVVAIISSVRTGLTTLDPTIDPSQETVAGDAVLRSFRPDLPGYEYPTPNTKPPAPSQDSEEYSELMDREDSRITLNPDSLCRSRFTSSSPILNKFQVKKPSAGSWRSNSKEVNVGTLNEEWKPKQLSNGNYR